MHRLIMNHDLDKGSQIPYIERAMKEGFEVVVFNTNLNKYPDVSRDSGVEVHSVKVTTRHLVFPICGVAIVTLAQWRSQT